MKPNFRNHLTLVATLALFVLALLAMNGCSERNPAELPPAQAGVDPVVFDDAFGTDVDYSAFEFSYYEALTQESSGGYNDSPTLKITVPANNWAGGSFWTHSARDLSSFNALTFWAKANQPLNLAECGLGIPIVTDGFYKLGISDVALNGTGKEIIIPIPDPSKLTNEKGMFWYSHGTGGVEIWVDEVIFRNVIPISNPRPVMKTESVEALLGEVVPITDTKTTYNVNGADLEVTHSPAYFTYFSSDETVIATPDGVPTAVGGGSATVTAKLIDTDVVGEVTVAVIAPPSDPAPTPTHDQADVISLFSDAYSNNTTVDTWRATWSTSTVSVFDQEIQGDNVKAYTGLSSAYVGIEFTNDQIDAETPGMTSFHMDVFAPAGSMLAIKLVDFGPDGGHSGGDDTEKELIFHAGSTPPFVSGQWVSMDIPLSDFTGMNYGNLAQLVLRSTNLGNIWIDNLYFHK